MRVRKQTLLDENTTLRTAKPTHRLSTFSRDAIEVELFSGGTHYRKYPAAKQLAHIQQLKNPKSSSTLINNHFHNLELFGVDSPTWNRSLVLLRAFLSFFSFSSSSSTTFPWGCTCTWHLRTPCQGKGHCVWDLSGFVARLWLFFGLGARGLCNHNTRDP